jgi:hypothetical protein
VTYVTEAGTRGRGRRFRDAHPESTEAFSVKIGVPTNAVLGRTTGTGQILDDD